MYTDLLLNNKECGLAIEIFPGRFSQKVHDQLIFPKLSKRSVVPNNCLSLKAGYWCPFNEPLAVFAPKRATLQSAVACIAVSPCLSDRNKRHARHFGKWSTLGLHVCGGGGCCRREASPQARNLPGCAPAPGGLGIHSSSQCTHSVPHQQWRPDRKMNHPACSSRGPAASDRSKAKEPVRRC